jgi:CDP-diacylglycerol--glycerol-3-phosphate 3-phosphatidyltransferase
MGTLVFMVYLDRLPLWGAVAVIVILGRELTVTALRTIAMSEGVVIAARQGGKEKTALQMVAILLLIMQHRYTIDFFFFSVSADLTQVGVVVLYLSLVFALTSGGEDFARIGAAVEAKERRLLAGEAEDADEASPEEPREL